jgi:RNA polymerase sigma-70 factor (ECF subfamily)
VYRDHARLVRRTLARLGVREADQMDAAQNVFLVVHRKLPAFEGRAELGTWLVSICRFVAKDYRRSAPIRREVVVGAHELGGLDVGTCDERPAEACESARRLQDILGRIPEKLRMVVIMFELEERSGGEIARLLDVPVGTVRSRLRLARSALKRAAAESTAN